MSKVRVFTQTLKVGLTYSFSAADYLQGKVKVDEYVTHGYKLAEINDGFEAMHVNSCLFVSVSCLTVLSRMAIASALSSRCHEFRRKGGERNLVVLLVVYECSTNDMASNSSGCTRNLVGMSQTRSQVTAGSAKSRGRLLRTSLNDATHSVFKLLGPLLDKLATILDID